MHKTDSSFKKNCNRRKTCYDALHYRIKYNIGKQKP